jgi:hypothetical protein
MEQAVGIETMISLKLLGREGSTACVQLRQLQSDEFVDYCPRKRSSICSLVLYGQTQITRTVSTRIRPRFLPWR